MHNDVITPSPAPPQMAYCSRNLVVRLLANGHYEKMRDNVIQQLSIVFRLLLSFNDDQPRPYVR